jgi:glutathione S-transferase
VRLFVGEINFWAPQRRRIRNFSARAAAVDPDRAAWSGQAICRRQGSGTATPDEPIGQRIKLREGTGIVKLYDSRFAPNPRRVRIFLAEKNLNVPTVNVDLARLEQKSDDFSSLNSFQTIPILEFDDGAVLCESIAICRYFEETQPDPPLFGVGSLERARVEMWQRRLEFGLFIHVANAFRHSHPHMAQMERPQIAELASSSKLKAAEVMSRIDRELGDRPFIAGDRFSVADITGLVALDFAKTARIAIPEELGQLRRWREALSARPSARA